MSRKIRQFAEAYLITAEGAPEEKLREVTRRFVQALMRRRQRRMLPKIVRAVAQLWDERHGLSPVRITTARQIDYNRLREISGAAPLVRRIEPEIIGGAIVERGDERFDGSVRAALDRLRTTLLTKEI